MNKKTIKLKYLDQDSTVTEQEKGPFFEILQNRYEVVFSDNPEYVIYGPFGDEHLNYIDAVKIFYTGECVTPDFNECDYAIGFDRIEFGDRYFRYPLWLKYGRTHNERMECKHLAIDESLLDRDFCSFVVSNDYADMKRTELFSGISRYKRIDSGGRYMNNVGKPEGVEDKIAFSEKYKFSLAFENCSYRGYTTEKIMEAYEAKTVPIYWGDPDVELTFNPKSFINCNRFQNIESLIEEIRRVDEDNEAYLDMLRAPALSNESEGIDAQNPKLEEFIYHIFDQNIDEAYRRNRKCWGLRYNNYLLNHKRVYDKIEKIRCIVRKITLRNK